MALTTLKEDLMQEFAAEQDMVNEQMEMLDPLGTSLRKPAAQRLLSNTTLILTEYGCYCLSLGAVFFLFKMSEIYPFSVLSTISHDVEVTTKIGGSQVTNLVWAEYGVAALGIIFMLIIGKMAGVIRKKNAILHHAGKDIKIILGQHLERKASIEAIVQRHQYHFDISGITIPPKKKATVNDVMNPGYGDDEDDDYTEENED